MLTSLADSRLRLFTRRVQKVSTVAVKNTCGKKNVFVVIRFYVLYSAFRHSHHPHWGACFNGAQCFVCPVHRSRPSGRWDFSQRSPSTVLVELLTCKKSLQVQEHMKVARHQARGGGGGCDSPIPIWIKLSSGAFEPRHVDGPCRVKTELPAPEEISYR